MRKKKNRKNIFTTIIVIILIPFTVLNAASMNVINQITQALFKITVFK